METALGILRHSELVFKCYLLRAVHPFITIISQNFQRCRKCYFSERMIFRKSTLFDFFNGLWNTTAYGAGSLQKASFPWFCSRMAGLSLLFSVALITAIININIFFRNSATCLFLCILASCAVNVRWSNRSILHVALSFCERIWSPFFQRSIIQTVYLLHICILCLTCWIYWLKMLS